jgi:hypothetical protein
MFKSFAQGAFTQRVERFERFERSFALGYFFIDSPIDPWVKSIIPH